MSKMRQFRFDVGNSTDGPVGFVAVISARTKEEAIVRLKAVMPTEWELPFVASDGKRMGEYMCVYFAPENVTLRDLDEEMGP